MNNIIYIYIYYMLLCAFHGTSWHVSEHRVFHNFSHAASTTGRPHVLRKSANLVHVTGFQWSPQKRAAI